MKEGTGMIHVSVAGFAMVMEVLGLVFGVLGAFVIFFVFQKIHMC